MKSLKKIGIGLLAAFTCMISVSQTALASGTDSYVTGDDSYRQPVPESYVVVRTINNIGGYEDDTQTFREPQDLFVDKQDNIYIVDTLNKRVVKMNSNFETVGVFYGPDKPFNSPQGIFVDDDGDFLPFSCLHDRHCYEAALGKNNIGAQLLQKLFGLQESLRDAKRIREIFEIEVSAQLSRGDPVIGDAEFFNQFFFDSVIGTDVLNIVVELPQARDQCNIWSDMTGCSAAAENDSLHTLLRIE